MFRNNFVDLGNLLRSCALAAESTAHYFGHCKNFSDQCRITWNELKKYQQQYYVFHFKESPPSDSIWKQKF